MKVAVYLLITLFIFMPLHVKCPWYVLILLLGIVGLKLHDSGIFNMPVLRVLQHLYYYPGDLYSTLFGVLVVLALLLRVLWFETMFHILVMFVWTSAFYFYCQCAEEPEPQTNSIPDFDNCCIDNLCSICLPAVEGIPEQTFQHNRDFLHSLSRGDGIAFQRQHRLIRNYQHTAIYIGQGMLIHKTNCNNVGQVLQQGFWEVAGSSEGELYKNYYHFRPLPADEVVKRAESKLGLNPCTYNPFIANCEHFTNWCKYDRHWSPQVDRIAPAFVPLRAAGILGRAFGRVDRLN